jgi:hypothetical protein
LGGATGSFAASARHGGNLKTSLERCFERESIAGDARTALEAELLREFMRTFHNYAVHIPEAAA